MFQQYSATCLHQGGTTLPDVRTAKTLAKQKCVIRFSLPEEFLFRFIRGRFRVAIGAIAPPPKNYESNFIHHDFLQFGKQHLRYKAIVPSTVFSQRCSNV